MRLCVGIRLVCVMCLMFCGLINSAFATLYYVNERAQGKNNGTSWVDAYSSLQTALHQAISGDILWVAEGTYYPSDQKDRDQSFVLPAGVLVLGGFSGHETKVSQRIYKGHQTILDGDIQQDRHPKHFSRHVVTMGDQSVLDGFIVQHGYATHATQHTILNIDRSIVHRLVRFVKKVVGYTDASSLSFREDVASPVSGHAANHTTPENIMRYAAATSGAGILSFHHAGLVRNCVIRDNVANKGAGAYNMTAPGHQYIPVYINDRFENNTAVLRGGGMSNDLGTSPLVINSQFVHNISQAKGGGMYNDFGSSPLVVNTVFERNTAERAAAFGSDGGSRPILVNAMFSYNAANSLGAVLYQGSYNVDIPDGENRTTVIDSRFQGNKSQTNGPLIFTWGLDRYYFYRSPVPDGPAVSSSSIPKRYTTLVQWAGEIKNLEGDRITINYPFVTPFLYQQKAGKRDSKNQDAFAADDASSHQVMAVPSKVLYVNAAHTEGKEDGLSWHTAYHNLQTAIDQAAQIDGAQIWIAEGIYTPPLPKHSRAENATFRLHANVALYGGFQGTETKRKQRDPDAHLTRLSGALPYRPHEKRMYAYHVVTGAAPSIIDGVTISDGNASGEGLDAFGAGLLMWGPQQSTDVFHTVFTHNKAYYGGAVFAFNHVASQMAHDSFKNNNAAMGGAIYISFGSNIQLIDSQFANNYTDYRGGAVVVNYGAHPIVKRDVFTNNVTDGVGGAMWLDDQASQFGGTSATVTESQFLHNRAEFIAGAISVVNKATIVMKNNEFRYNTPPQRPAVSE